VYRTTVPGHGGLLGCVEYISVGDFNNDGLDDMALVSQGSPLLRVYPGNGDATFDPPLHFGNTGGRPVFLIAEDLDKDGRIDVISADSGSRTIFFGKEGEQLFESTQSVSGYGSARAYAVGDFDKDGLPDFFYADTTRAVVRVFLKPGLSEPTGPAFTITTAARNSILDVGDLNGDGIVDLVTGNTGDDVVLTALLDAEGNVSEKQSMPRTGNPKAVAVGFLDEGTTVDLVALCTDSLEAELSISYGRGDGTFDAGPVVPTIAGAKLLDTGDIDGHGLIDVGVVAPGEIAFHYGVDGGSLSPPTGVIPDASRTFSDIKLAELNGDGNVDVLTGNLRAAAVRFYKGTGARELEDPIALNAGVVPILLEVVDIDRDGRLDVAAGSRSARSVAMLYNLGEEGFSDPQVERVGLSLSAFRILDVNDDRKSRVASVASTSTRRGSTKTTCP